MSLESNKSRNDYIGNGAVNQYSYTFKIFNEEHLRLTVKDLDDVEVELQLGVDYTVTGVGDEAGGNILLTSNGQAWIDANDFLVEDFVFTIRRVVPLTQETDFRNQGSFLPENHEDTFDLSRMVDQQQQDEIDRSVKLPETIPAADFDASLPGNIQDPDRVVITNPTGTGFEMGPTANDIQNAQAYAESAEHSKDTAKDWAIKTDGTVIDSETGVDSGEYSSKENAIGVLRRGQAGGGSSKDWANHTGGTVNDTEYSAKHYADLAAASAAAAVTSAATAALNAAKSNWNDVIYLTAASSPYTVADSQSGALFEVDATAGEVVINLPEIANLDLNGPFSYSFVKSDNSANEVKINGGGTDTVGDVAQEILDYQTQGITIVPDLDQMPDAWAVLRYGQEPVAPPVPVNPEDKNIKLLSEGEVEHVVTGSSTFTSVYDQQLTGGSVVIYANSPTHGAAWFQLANSYTNIKKVKIKLYSSTDATGTIPVTLVEADANGKPLVNTVVSTFPAVDASLVTLNTSPNGTLIELEAPTSFDLDSAKKYAFIYETTGVSAPSTVQVAIMGLADAGLVGDGLFNAGDINDVNDWVAQGAPANAMNLALELIEEQVVPAGAELNILDKMYLSIPGLPNTSNEIAVGNYPMTEGDVAVVRINRTATASTIGVVIQPVATVLDPDDIVIARYFNGELYVGHNSILRLASGETGMLDAKGTDFDITELVDVDDKIAVLQEVFSSGQSYDLNLPADSLTKRLINNAKRDTSWITLDIPNNRFLIQPGLYRADISAPALALGGHRVYLMEYDNGALIKRLKSNNAYSRVNASPVSDQNYARINDVLHVTVPTWYEVHHFNETTSTLDGDHGVRVDEAGESEIYTTALFERIGELTRDVTYNTTVNGIVDPESSIYKVQHRTPFNGNGGSSIVGDQVRELNHVETDQAWASLDVATDIVTVQPGKYDFEFWHTMYRTNRHQVKLENITGNQTYLGASGYSAPSGDFAMTPSTGSKNLTLNVATQFRVVSFGLAAVATSGLGVGKVQNFGDNIFAEMKIRKLGDV